MKRNSLFQKKYFIKDNILLIAAVLSFFAFSVQAKNKVSQSLLTRSFLMSDSTLKANPPIDVPIAQAAPHIPIMLKAKGSGSTFTFEGTIYDNDLNIENLKSWIQQYPNEVSNYQKVIDGLLNQNKSDADSNLFASSYKDAKAQYALIQKLLK